MELNDRKAAAYRLGLITLIILAVMTVAEYFVSIYTGSVSYTHLTLPTSDLV